MSPEKPPSEAPPKGGLLHRALHESELVRNKVERAAVDLSSVNAVLKDEIAEGVILANVEDAVNQSEAVEVQVQEAATELVSVNDALADEIGERHALEDQLLERDAALSASRAKERQSRHSALHDPVTGLPNLTLFNDRLGTALAQAQRHAWKLAVMFVDLDDFKSINDTSGHDAGDRVLQMVATRLQASIRASDTVSRRSGDEFLILMLETKDEASVVAFAAKIVSAIADACEIDELKLTVTASVGIAIYPDDGLSAQDLLKNADTAMYAAKQQKKGPVLYGHIERV